MSKVVLRKIMENAWRLARAGQRKHGGKVREYFAEALRIVWSREKEKGLVGCKEAREIRFVRRGDVTEKQANYIIALLQKIGDRLFDSEWVEWIEKCDSKRIASNIISELKPMAYAPKWL